jgi:ATP-dependent RNA helicase RhlE
MESFEALNLSTPLLNALEDLGFTQPTPIQAEAFSVIRSGKDVVGISQTGTGKTLAYMLPILRDLSFSKQANPRILVLVPTRELVVQVVENIESFAKYMTVRVAGVYGGVNINTQAQGLTEGCDILVATPGRLYDLVLARAIQLKSIGKLVIDEVDVMLDLGFRFQINNLLELMPERRQNIMFSATMTEEIDTMIDDFFIAPSKIAISLSGTPLDNIEQTAYRVKNFYTKVNLLTHLIADEETFHKVLVFVSSKKNADRLFEALEPADRGRTCVIHSNKTQNYRLRSIEEFDSGQNRMLIATDVMARGLDLDKISHVINFDTPGYPENYIHRIGRTGRAQHAGKSILFSTEAEEESKLAIEVLMNYEIPTFDTPEEVEVSPRLIPDERPREVSKNHNRNTKHVGGAATHEKSAKNKKVNLGGSYRREIAKKYKKAKTRGDKNANRRKR